MKTVDEIERIIHENPAVMLYFSAPTCNVCHALKPKLFEAIESHFEKFVIA
ncbi:MAG: thioredoxin family protein, partial [Epsilonproteobacteria bacterium]|nr:thioredoxin family protein [Campylobacterota bacterium]